MPQDILTKYKLNSLKLYMNVQNGWVFSSWEYFDPENKGLTPRIVNLGLNLTL